MIYPSALLMFFFYFIKRLTAPQVGKVVIWMIPHAVYHCISYYSHGRPTRWHNSTFKCTIQLLTVSMTILLVDLLLYVDTLVCHYNIYRLTLRWMAILPHYWAGDQGDWTDSYKKCIVCIRKRETSVECRLHNVSVGFMMSICRNINAVSMIVGCDDWYGWRLYWDRNFYAGHI